MKSRIPKLILSACLLVAAGTLVMRLGTPQKVGAASGCTAKDAAGIYAVQLSGWVTPPGAPAGTFAPFAEGGTWTVEQNGTFRGASSVSAGGQPFQFAYTGTFQVNADCTVPAKVTARGQTENALWIIVKPNEEMMLLSLTPGTTTSGRAVRIGPSTEGMLRDMARAMGLILEPSPSGRPD